MVAKKQRWWRWVRAMLGRGKKRKRAVEDDGALPFYSFDGFATRVSSSLSDHNSFKSVFLESLN
jgi:hypothetical protein